MNPQSLFFNGMILVGAGFMLTSILLSLKMLPPLPHIFRRQWTILTALMCFFLLGYIGFILIHSTGMPLPAEFISALVFLGGSIFVYLILRLIRQVIADLINKDKLIQAINQDLEDKVEQRTAELEQSLTEVDQLSVDLSQILNTISTGVRLIDRDCIVQRVNRSFCTMTGMKEEELVGSKCYTCFLDERCRQSDLCTLHQIDMAGRAIHTEVVKTTKSGKKLHCMLTATPYRDKEGSVMGIVEDFQDISERVQAEQDREQMQTQLLQRSKLESVGQLAAGIAHEINTPIQYIGTNIDFFSESFEDISHLFTTLDNLAAQGENETDPKQVSKTIHEALEQADWEFLREEIPTALAQTRDGVNRVSAIVRAMKEFSHPGSREKVPADLNEIIKNTLMVSSNEWKYAAEIETHFGDLPMVPCLSDEMGQVFLNIIVNAAHAIGNLQEQTGTEEKGRITIATSTEDDFAEIRITDSGGGMAEEVRKRVFDPFFTTKEVGKGTGQGLSIAHNVIITKHQGTITVDSEVDKGTTFIIRLPLKERKDQADEQV